MEEHKEQKQYSAEQIMKLLSEKKSDFWIEEGRKRSLALFHEAAQRVPAYKDFLKKNNVDPKKIKTWADFQTRVPVMSKKNYLRQYPLEKLCWDGSLKKPLVFTATSGSTGEPFYFCRQQQLDWQYSTIIESFLKNSSYGKEGPVLVIVGFGMGIWIGGLITYKAFEIASQRLNYPLSLITPGINKGEILNALQKLSPQFSQTIIIGYPPFIKDVVDEAIEQKIDLKKLNIRFLFAAESFTEKFRDYLVENAGVGNPYADILNIYGTADIGAMAYETTTGILVKRVALKNKNLFEGIFTQITKTPTLAQYNPLFINFEAPSGEIVLTGDNTIPLIRYAVGDHGGVLSFNEAEEKLKKHNISLIEEAKKEGISDASQLPFVYVYERADFSTKLYGAIIYPEHIRHALQDDSLSDFFTGKFTMLTQLSGEHDQYLEINIELKRHAKDSRVLKQKTCEIIVKTLLEKNSEYQNNHKMMPQKVIPKVIFWSHEDPLYFKPGVKQKWVKK